MKYIGIEIMLFFEKIYLINRYGTSCIYKLETDFSLFN